MASIQHHRLGFAGQACSKKISCTAAFNKFGNKFMRGLQSINNYANFWPSFNRVTHAPKPSKQWGTQV
jgi:hypothetical protein